MRHITRGEAMAEEVWYYARGGQQYGPVTEDTLRALAANAGLVPGDLVWREGMTQWQPAQTVPGLFAAAPQQQPINYYSSPQAPLNYYAPPDIGRIYAGFWIRFVAAFIDALITGAAGYVIGMILSFIGGAAMGTSGTGMGNG